MPRIHRRGCKSEEHYLTRRPLMTLCILIAALLALIRAAGGALVPLPPDVVSAGKWTNTSDPVRVTGFVAESEAREDSSYLILKRAVLSASPDLLLNRRCGRIFPISF